VPAHPPATVTLDIDDTVDVVHGHQSIKRRSAATLNRDCRLLVGRLMRLVSRQPAVELDPDLRLHLAVERALSSDDDTTPAQRDAISSIPVNEDVIDWWGHPEHVGSHCSICIPPETFGRMAEPLVARAETPTQIEIEREPALQVAATSVRCRTTLPLYRRIPATQQIVMTHCYSSRTGVRYRGCVTLRWGAETAIDHQPSVGR
jgi:hypothetical protein